MKDKKYRKVRDHCNYTVEYRGVAHSICNLKYSLQLMDHNNNKFILLLRKGVYPYDYMDDWEKFNETSLPETEDFYIHLYIEDIC